MIAGLRFRKLDEIPLWRWMRPIGAAVFSMPVSKISKDSARQFLRRYRHDGPRPVSNVASTPMDDIFWDHKGPIIDKWLHYLPIYDRYFARFRYAPVRILEIGVSKGGSLAMWRKYFGGSAIIFGIDIDKTCLEQDGQFGSVRIGSQTDTEFLEQVVSEMGGIDIVIDDGSHRSPDIKASFEYLFPKLANGGVYLIEDLHTAYWDDFSGGYRSHQSFMNVLKQIVDDMHHWYHTQGEKIKASAGHVSGLFFHDSIAVIEKNKISAPCHTRIGAVGVE